MMGDAMGYSPITKNPITDLLETLLETHVEKFLEIKEHSLKISQKIGEEFCSVWLSRGILCNNLRITALNEVDVIDNVQTNRKQRKLIRKLISTKFKENVENEKNKYHTKTITAFTTALKEKNESELPMPPKGN